MDVTRVVTSGLAGLARSLLCLGLPALVVVVVWIIPLSADDPRATPDAVAELHAAVSMGDPAGVERALARGAPVDATESCATITPLMWAARSGDLGLVQLLLAHGADVHAQTPAFGTPLSNAASSGNPQVLELLLSHGADPDAGRPDGYTPLMSAAAAGVTGDVAAELLIRAGADVNIRNRAGDSALAIAVEEGDARTVRLLRAAGAEASIPLASPTRRRACTRD
jgi:ankyrin repeat protein